MTLLPLATCAQVLGIHPKTLHHWLKTANLPLVTHPTDARIKCLTEHDLSVVARLHDRSLTALPSASPEEPITWPAHDMESDHLSGSSSPMRGDEPDLIQKLSSLEAKVVTMQEQLTELALALLAEREGTIERRIAALETMMTQRLGHLPSVPPGPMAAPTLSPPPASPGPRALNPAELSARARLIPLIEYGMDGTYVVMCPQEGELPLVPDSPEWFAWLASLSSFRFVGQSGRFTASRGSKQHRPTRSWRAVRSLGNHNYKYHLGVTDHLTVARLEQAAATLQAHRISL